MPDDSLPVSHIPYGLLGSRIVHISELTKADKGLACKCHCPVCGIRLLAKSIGGKYTAHFAHEKNSSECINAAETGIHLKAKEIICQRLSLNIPEFKVKEQIMVGEKYYSVNGYVAKGVRGFLFDEASPEEWRGGFRPDIVARKSDREIFIEIRVTHEVDEDKRKKIADQNISCIEVDLSAIDRMASPDDIESAIDKLLNLHWVHHAKELDVRWRLRQKLIEKESELLEEHRKEKERLKQHRQDQAEKHKRKKDYAKYQRDIEASVTYQVIECMQESGRIIIPALKKEGEEIAVADRDCPVEEVYGNSEPGEYGVYLRLSGVEIYLAFFFGNEIHKFRYRKIQRRQGYSIGLSLQYLKQRYVTTGRLLPREIHYHLYGPKQGGGFWICHPEWKANRSSFKY
ncbi:hypothetical protein [Halomonas sp. A40-4]|uniref:hypothetical protein n=1 Tax=Halomonas sp. A40-4 TaxID=2785909 RepID=UPI001E31B68B|nr:hypothetical protein [Halomonas sp. A40-4]